MIRPLLLLVLLAAPALAQPSHVGEPFPLTNTRYGADTASRSRVVTDGRDFYLFWSAASNIRMTKLVAGERRAGRAVAPPAPTSDFDVVWTGRHFLVAFVDFQTKTIHAQLVNLDGERVGGPIPVGGTGLAVRLIPNGRAFLLIYTNVEQPGSLWVATLSESGVTRAPRQLLFPAAGQYFRYADGASNGNGFAVVAGRPDGDRLFLFDRDGELQSATIFDEDLWTAQIVSDGRGGYLLMRMRLNTTTDADTVMSRVDANGTFLDSTPLDGEDGRVIDILWNGAGYTAAIVDVEDRSTRIVYLDQSGQHVTATEPVAPQTDHLAISVLGTRTLLNWGSFIAELPLTSPAGTVATFGAANQSLLTTAAGPHSTLLVWSESIDGKSELRAGVRASDGRWTEQVLAAQSSEFALAVDNGREFAVFYRFQSSRNGLLRRIAYDGSLTGQPVNVTAPFNIHSILWNGASYVLAGADYHFFQFTDLDMKVAFMSADGTVSEPVLVRGGTVGRPQLAWNGQTYLATWNLDQHPDNPLRGARLDASLHRLSAQDLDLGNDPQWSAKIAADGSDFLVLRNDVQLSLTRVSSTGSIGTPVPIPESSNAGYSMDLAPVSGGIAVTWQNEISRAYRVATFRQGSSAVVSSEVVLETYTLAPARVVAMPGGRAAFVTSVPNDAAPHHGARRVTAVILDLAPLAPPATAPTVTVRLQGSRYRIEWTALPEPVTGYRVEYRIGDGNWNEIERSPDPDVRSATFIPTRPATVYAFRVRAMNDGGMGPYSKPVAAYTGKRRATR